MPCIVYHINLIVFTICNRNHGCSIFNIEGRWTSCLVIYCSIFHHSAVPHTPRSLRFNSNWMGFSELSFTMTLPRLITSFERCSLKYSFYQIILWINKSLAQFCCIYSDSGFITSTSRLPCSKISRRTRRTQRTTGQWCRCRARGHHQSRPRGPWMWMPLLLRCVPRSVSWNRCSPGNIFWDLLMVVLCFSIT